ncbi:MAG: hypothetical protein BJ554DRAFT_55 [Olpidium bornovanus]|uniref:Uncharacterized protein n=1 Tax=Olpidium bornovanus TaxID=278681 RepID=A0A8H8A1Q7_9FUNG|nr:MAG: hypothetical protein BJ554DRAFT_55 [Olpidium bornovanus]
MSTFPAAALSPSASFRLCDRCRETATSNAFVVFADRAPPPRHWPAPTPAAAAAVSPYGTLTPLPSPPQLPSLSTLAPQRPQANVAPLVGPLGLSLYAPADAGAGFAPAPVRGTAPQGAGGPCGAGLAAGTWPEDAPAGAFAGDFGGMAAPAPQPPPAQVSRRARRPTDLPFACHAAAPPPPPAQVFRRARRPTDLPFACHQGPYRDDYQHQRYFAAFLRAGGGDAGFYAWPTPPVETSQFPSWPAAAQPDGAAGGAQFDRNPVPASQFFGLEVPCSAPRPPPADVRALAFVHGQPAHNRYQPHQASPLQQAAGGQPQGLQQVGIGRLPTCCASFHPTRPRRKLTTSFWEEGSTTCYQVVARGICVARRKEGPEPVADNNMVNGTKLLNVAGLSRGKRDALLKGEKVRTFCFLTAGQCPEVLCLRRRPVFGRGVRGRPRILC